MSACLSIPRKCAVIDRTYSDTSRPIHNDSDRTADVGALCERMSSIPKNYAVIDRTYIDTSRPIYRCGVAGFEAHK